MQTRSNYCDDHHERKVVKQFEPGGAPALLGTTCAELGWSEFDYSIAFPQLDNPSSSGGESTRRVMKASGEGEFDQRGVFNPAREYVFRLRWLISPTLDQDLVENLRPLGFVGDQTRLCIEILRIGSFQVNNEGWVCIEIGLPVSLPSWSTCDEVPAVEVEEVDFDTSGHSTLGPCGGDVHNSAVVDGLTEMTHACANRSAVARYSPAG